MNKSYSKIIIAVFLLSVLFVSISADAATLYLNGPACEIVTPAYKLKGVMYVPLIAACKSHDIAWEWDSIGKVVVLKKDNLEARLKVGSYRVYVNGKIKTMIRV